MMVLVLSKMEKLSLTTAEIFKDVTMLGTLAAIPSSLEVAPRLAHVQLLMAGTNHLEKAPLFQDRKVPFSNAAGIQSCPIAEWVMMMILTASRKYDQIHEYQRSSTWPAPAERMAIGGVAEDSVGKRIGIVGYGSIGRQIARLAQAFGMDVVVLTASKKEDASSRKYTGWNLPGTGDPDGVLPSAWFSGSDKTSVHKFLSHSLDYLVLALPLTADSKGMLGKEEFNLLSQRHAYVLNVSRGEIIVQDDLVEALHEFKNSNGKNGIRGAALDVTTPEPLPSDNPLWSAPNITISPHLCGVTAQFNGRTFDLLAANVRNHLEGKPMVNLLPRQPSSTASSL